LDARAAKQGKLQQVAELKRFYYMSTPVRAFILNNCGFCADVGVSSEIFNIDI